MEMIALLKLHETTIVPMLLTNSETWVLQKEQQKKLERIEIWALKKLIGLPVTTPTVAIILLTGCLFTTQRIHQRQLLYLKTLLDRPRDNWTLLSLLHQKSENMWWAKHIDSLLEQYKLDYSWDAIKNMSFADWKRSVKIRIEEKHIERLKDGCSGAQGEKTKTKFFHNMLNDDNYRRNPSPSIINRTNLGARTIIMAMSGMLDCRNNYHFKYGTKLCDLCRTTDDETHRINYCRKFENVNLYHSDLKFEFKSIYSKDQEVVN